MNLKSCAKYLFLYVDRKTANNFWAFSGGKYHRFVFDSNYFRYIRSQKYLPDSITGICHLFSEDGYENIIRESSHYNIQLNFYDDVTGCEQGEVLEVHPEHIFGLSQPILLWQTDPIDRDRGNEPEER